MRRFFVSPEDVGEETIVIDDREDIRHMKKVLRLSKGDEIDISDSTAWEYRTEIILLDDEKAEARILDKQRFTAEPKVRVTLFQGIPKQGKMETIVQKSVELGVAAVVPVFMARTVVTDKGNFEKKIQRWQKVADEAVKQCRRGVIPQVSRPMKLREMIDKLEDFDMVLFPYENERGITIKDVLRGDRAEECGNCEAAKNSDAAEDIAVIIGPEGGFSDQEAKEIVAAGGISLSLGKTVLRTETAGMAAIAMIMYEKEL